MFDYTILFLTVMIFCSSLVLYMSFNMNSDLGDSLEIIVFRTLCFAFEFDILMQAIWSFSSLYPSTFPRWLNWLVNAGDLAATMIIICLWFDFIFLKMTPHPARHALNKKNVILSALPALFVCFLDITSIFTHLMFYINEGNHYTRGPLYPIQALICLMYYILTLIILFAHQTRVRHQKSYIRMYMIFTLFPIVGGVLQVVYPKAPFTIITVTTAIFYLYSSLQKHSINTDALTGLNNRNRMEQYLSQRIDHADHNPFYLFIADVDCFKQINDTYGHVAGDEALSTVATALKAQGKKYRSFFACRYGGDEFVFTIDKSEVASLREKPDAIVVSINEAIRQQIDQKNMQYQLRLSAGMAEVNRTDSDISDLIHQADEELYKEKNEIHDTKGFRGIRSNR